MVFFIGNVKILFQHQAQKYSTKKLELNVPNYGSFIKFIENMIKFRVRKLLK